MSNGRGALLAHLKNLRPHKTDAQLKDIMSRQLGKAGIGIISPKKTGMA
jgi:hypothetical protein